MLIYWSTDAEDRFHRVYFDNCKYQIYTITKLFTSRYFCKKNILTLTIHEFVPVTISGTSFVGVTALVSVSLQSLFSISTTVTFWHWFFYNCTKINNVIEGNKCLSTTISGKSRSFHIFKIHVLFIWRCTFCIETVHKYSWW